MASPSMQIAPLEDRALGKTVRHRGLAVFVLALALFGTSAPALAEECPFSPLLSPVKAIDRLAASLGGVRLSRLGDGLSSVDLSADGAIDYRYEHGGSVMYIHHCSTPANASIQGRTATGSCDAPPDCFFRVWIAEPDESYLRQCRAEQPDQTIHMMLSVKARSATLLRAAFQWQASNPIRAPAFYANFVKEGREFRETMRKSIQLFQGGTNAKLLAAIKAELQRPPAQGMSWCPILFEASKARDPHEFSEIYYVGEINAAEAREWAKRLEPITGPVAVKPWPGEWDYDLVIVAGAKKAESQQSKSSARP